MTAFMANRTNLIMLAALAVTLLVLLWAVIARRRYDDELEINKLKKGSHKNYLMVLYHIYQNTPLLNRYLAKVEGSLKNIYPADAISIRKRTARLLLKNTLLIAGGIIFAMVFGAGDIFYMLAIIATVLVYIDSSTNETFVKLDEKILEQFAGYLDAVVHYYHKRPILDYVLRHAAEKQPYEISMHAARLEDIISSTPGEMNVKIAEYAGTQPNKFMLMFLSICASTKISGDKKLEKEDGQSLFLHNVHLLKDELRTELLYKQKNRKMFKGLAGATLVCIFLIKPYQFFIHTSFPELNSYYAGIYGIASMIATFVVALLSYEVISVLRDNGAGTEKTKENSIWVKVSRLPFLNVLLSTYEAKYYTKSLRINEELRTIGDHTGAKAFYAKKLVLGIAAFMLTVILSASAIVMQRVQTIRNFAADFSESITVDAKYADSMEKYAELYMREVRKMDPEDIDKELLMKDIRDNTELKQMSQIELVADALISHNAKLHDTYYKWYLLVLALVIGALAFMWPTWFLSFRGKSIKQRKEDEVMQFQTLMLILMHTGGMTLNEILEWMERFSYCFKQTIAQARTQLSGGTAKALEKMKEDESGCPSFCHFVDNLLDISNAGVEKAFDELQSDRAFRQKERVQAQDFSLEERLNKANFAYRLPLLGFILVYIIIPMTMYAWQMWSGMMSMI